jgi:hypothetical protein
MNLQLGSTSCLQAGALPGNRVSFVSSIPLASVSAVPLYVAITDPTWLLFTYCEQSEFQAGHGASCPTT